MKHRASAAGTGLTPDERRLRAQLGAYSLHAQRDAQETTQAARAAFDARFERLVDPRGELTQVERARRANAARRAHFVRMALRSAAVRRARKSA